MGEGQVVRVRFGRKNPRQSCCALLGRLEKPGRSSDAATACAATKSGWGVIPRQRLGEKEEGGALPRAKREKEEESRWSEGKRRSSCSFPPESPPGPPSGDADRLPPCALPGREARAARRKDEHGRRSWRRVPRRRKVPSEILEVPRSRKESRAVTAARCSREILEVPRW
jgi:hypothetical protein